MSESQRQFFRLNLNSLPMEIEIVSKNNRSVDPLVVCKGFIQDISGGGIGFTTKERLRLDINKPLMVKLNFILDHFSFSLHSSVLREIPRGNEYFYGSKFEDISKNERSQITSILLKHDLLERKKKIEEMIQNRKEKKR